MKPPSSPLALVTPFTADTEPSSESSSNFFRAAQNPFSLRHAASTGNLGSPPSPTQTRVPSLVPPPRIAEREEKEDNKENGSSEPVMSASPSHSLSSSSLHSPKDPPAPYTQASRVRRSPESSRTNTMSPPPPKQPPSISSHKPPSQRGSLLSKRSMPNLRGKGSISSFRDVSTHETVQVKDTDFELVRPTMPAAAMSGRSSEDSSIFGSDTQDSNYNNGSGGGEIRPPTVASNLSASSSMNSRSLKLDPQALTEAHRQREVRWMTLISREPAAQAYKSKRVKKMLLEGVPSSVRYPVWAHLTDSKARAMKGLYEKLQKRGRVPATPEIERDIRKLHMEQAHTQDAQGSLIALLQAYMTMVPDIQYQPGAFLYLLHHHSQSFRVV
jgi:TBC1 domain family member 10